nr:MAG TPA: hypothetical protein [Caudoviricetes sp.]
MERLTFEGNFCDIAQCRELPCKYDGNCTQKEVWERLKQFEDAVQTPEAAWAKKTIEMAFSDDTSEVERLRELYKADKEGRVVVLPCKVGDMLYEVTGRKTISVYKVKAIRVELFSLFIEWDIVEGFVWQYLNGINANEIGKTVFLTREEAEKALQEMEGKKDG